MNQKLFNRKPPTSIHTNFQQFNVKKKDLKQQQKNNLNEQLLFDHNSNNSNLFGEKIATTVNFKFF